MHVCGVVVVVGTRARGMVLVDEVARVRARACGCPSCRFVARGMFVGDDDVFVSSGCRVVDVARGCFFHVFQFIVRVDV